MKSIKSKSQECNIENVTSKTLERYIKMLHQKTLHQNATSKTLHLHKMTTSPNIRHIHVRSSLTYPIEHFSQNNSIIQFFPTCLDVLKKLYC